MTQIFHWMQTGTHSELHQGSALSEPRSLPDSILLGFRSAILAVASIIGGNKTSLTNMRHHQCFTLRDNNFKW